MGQNATLKVLCVTMWIASKCLSFVVRIRNSLSATNTLPRIRNPLLLRSATKLAHMIRTQEVTSEEVVRAYISRIHEVNPKLNCLVDERFEEAILEARNVDDLIQSGTKPAETLAAESPFLGVPISVKESIAVQGLSYTSGQKLPQSRLAEKDAVTVQLMKQAGAIPIVVTNTPELCMNYETDNRATGRTNNPYDLRRTPGGSSGGEAALISSAASIVGLSSDVGGSTRLPAAFTGIFGHKPTPGFVSNTGHCPTGTDPMWDQYFSIGLMGRYAEDLAPTLSVMSGCKAPELKLDQQVDMKQLKIFYIDELDCNFARPVSPHIRDALGRAVQQLETSCGVTAEKLHIPELKYAFEICSPILLRMKGIECMFQKSPGSEEWRSVFWEWVRYLCCQSTYSFPPLLYGVFKHIAENISEEEYRKVVQAHQNIMSTFKEKLSDNGVVLLPTFPDTAHFHKEIYYRVPDSAYMVIFNTTGMPVTVCPMGLSEKGLPIGIQVAANPFQDRLCIAAAKELERVFGGWIPPPCTNDKVVQV